MNRNCRRKTEKVYVKVTSDFDATGYMQPRQIILYVLHTPPALPSSTKKGRRNMKRRLIEYQPSPGNQNLVRRRLHPCTPTLWRSLRLRCSVVGGLAYVL